MQRRRLLAVAIAMVVASGCGSNEAEPPDDDGPRRAVESYVDALNSRDATALMRVGGVPEDQAAQREARRILAERGGRGLRIADLEIDHDFGPDVGSAALTARDDHGKDVRETVTVAREDGAWHVVVFTDRPSDKSPSSTDDPA
ncbi:hypothetical protein [Streptomyces sp. enrichment culture]|uniref:hypothetical protein n=1 Tax=Streptomyces sp. enrichment culture TaxID=1795815 RepID=UPI003F54F325